MRVEEDQLEVLAGVRHGHTLGSPVAVIVRNSEWPRWQDAMSAEPVEDSQVGKKLTAPRPGHADLAGMLKYNTRDARDILERASARETAARTVVGYLAKQLLAEINVKDAVACRGNRQGQRPRCTTPAVSRTSVPSMIPRSGASIPEVAAAMIAEIEAAKADRDTLGGVIEVLVYGLPAGIGSHVHWDRRLDARIAQALMSIQAIKGVELGDGFESARRRGSEAHDEIFYEDGFTRHTTRAGGTEGGMSIGGPLRTRAAMKPISTVLKGLQTVDINTKEAEKAFYERSDTCAVPAAGVVAEQMVAIVVAQECQRVFGGDTVEDFRRAAEAFRDRSGRF